MTESPWLVVIDLQRAFGEPTSGWAAEGYAELAPVVARLVDHFGGRVVFTRFVRDPAESDQWSAYYDRWPEFRVTPDDKVWDLTLDPGDAPVVDAPTFSKWGQALLQVVGDAPLVLCGVATECCVLSTAMAAADAGRRVEVVGDACAGVTRSLHQNALEILHQNAPLISVVTSGAVLAR